MLTDPSGALQAAIVARLKADAQISSLVGDRVYDRVPNVPTYPYVSYGDTQILPELGEGTDGVEAFVTIHAWERFKGFDDVKSIAKLVIASLHDVDLTISDNVLLSILLESARHLRDPDGLTSHSVLTFQILTDAG